MHTGDVRRIAGKSPLAITIIICALFWSASVQDGTTTVLVPQPMYAYTTASSLTLMDGRRVVATTQARLGAVGNGIVWTLDGNFVAAIDDTANDPTRLKTGESLDTDLSSATPTGHTAGVDSIVQPGDIWWDSDGSLHTILLTGPCHNDVIAPSATVTEWRLAGDKWSRVSPRELVEHRHLADGEQLELENEVLTLGTGESQKRVAAHVIHASAPLSTDGSQSKTSGDGCFLGATDSVGSRTGDIDGDGRADRVSLATCMSTSRPGSHKIVVHALLGNGREVEQTLPSSNEGGAVSWVGIADVNGDHRGDLFVIDNSGPHAEDVSVFEYRQERFVPLRGNVAPDQLVIDSSIATNSGFTCQVVDGHVRLIDWFADLNESVSPAQYTGVEEIYRPDGMGAMKKIGEMLVAYPAIPIGGGSYKISSKATRQIGAHCTGLDVMPNY